jgi:signal transduction histidine kinase
MRQRAAENPSEEIDWSIQAALNSADKLKQLVNDLIILHTIDAGELSTFRQAIDVNYEIKVPIEKRAQSWNKNLKIEFGIHPEVRIYAPRLEFTQAITHLLDNAAKFSPEAGKIRVLVLPNGEGGCIITIADEGPGIPAELREKVFERYYQIDAGDARQHGGLGVGLTIVRSIAASLGGTVKILDSEKGCRVQLTLPPATLDWKS